MATTAQDNEFAAEIKDHVEVNRYALDTAIDWIGKNLQAENVFSENELERWAEANGYIKE